MQVGGVQKLSVCVLCGRGWPSPPLRWWVLCGALPSVCVPCVCPLSGSPMCVPSVWVPCVGPLCGSPVCPPLCVGPLCGSPVWVSRRAASCGIYSRDASRSFTCSRLNTTTPTPSLPVASGSVAVAVALLLLFVGTQ